MSNSSEALLSDLLVTEIVERQDLLNARDTSWQRLHTFFWSRFAVDQKLSMQLRCRRSAWLLWACESLQRRELELRRRITLEAIAAIAGNNQFASATRLAVTGTRASHRSLDQFKAMSAVAAEFFLQHEASRIRLEWSEGAARSLIR